MTQCDTHSRSRGTPTIVAARRAAREARQLSARACACRLSLLMALQRRVVVIRARSATRGRAGRGCCLYRALLEVTRRNGRETLDGRACTVSLAKVRVGYKFDGHLHRVRTLLRGGSV